MSDNKVKISLGKYKAVSANIYKKRVFVHINEKDGRKSITLSNEEFEKLYKKMPRLNSIVQKFSKKIGSKKGSKKNAKKNDEDSSYSESDDSGSESD